MFKVYSHWMTPTETPEVHPFTLQLSLSVNPSYTLPNVIYSSFCYELSRIQLKIIPQDILALQHLLLKQKK